jgi:hypothetical protein
MFRVATISTVMLALVAGGAGRELWAGNSPSVNRAATPGLSDAQIERDIKARLARSPKISLDKFTVKVQGGIATFEGKTSVIQHKGVATRMAKSAGARAVVNNIQISDEARKQAADRLADGRKKAAVVKPAAPVPASAAAASNSTGVAAH